MRECARVQLRKRCRGRIRKWGSGQCGSGRMHEGIWDGSAARGAMLIENVDVTWVFKRCHVGQSGRPGQVGCTGGWDKNVVRGMRGAMQIRKGAWGFRKDATWVGEDVQKG